MADHNFNAQSSIIEHAQDVDGASLTEEEAVAYLLNHTGSADERAAKELAAALGYHPLALELAASCCRTGSLSEYLANYKEILEHKPDDMTYPEAVWGAIALAFELVNARCSEADKLLGPIAYLAPEEIPLDAFPQEYWLMADRMDVVNALADVSLIKTTTLSDGSPALSIHPMTQEVLRHSAEQAGQADSFKAWAVQRIADSFPGEDTRPDDESVWPQIQRLEPHARKILRFAPETGESADKTALLLNQYGLYLEARSQYAAAEPLLVRAMNITQETLGPEHPDMAVRLHNLAHLYHTANHLEEAEPLMKQALAVKEMNYSPNDPEVARGLNNLAGLYQAMERLEEAEPLMKRALAIDEANYGPDHPTVASRLNNMGGIYLRMNRFEEAEPLMLRALAIDEAQYEDNQPVHPSVAIRLNNLAGLYLETNRLREAKPLLRRALSIAENSLPEGHHFIISLRENLEGL